MRVNRDPGGDAQISPQPPTLFPWQRQIVIRGINKTKDMKMKNELKKDAKNEVWPKYIEDFREFYSLSMEGLISAAKVYVAAIDSDPNAKENFYKAFPRMTGMFSKIEAYGRGLLRREAFFLVGEVGEKVRRLGLSDQSVLIDSGVDYLTSSGDMLKVNSDTMTPQQARQIIDQSGHIRTIAQQKAWIETQKMRDELNPRHNPERKQKAATGPAYSVKDGKLIIHREVTFDRKQLFTILQGMF